MVEAIGDSGAIHPYESPGCSLVLALPVLVSSPSATADSLIEQLWKLGIEARRGYHPLHRAFGLPRDEFPRTEALWQRLVLVPLTRPLNRRQRNGLERLRSETMAGA